MAASNTIRVKMEVDQEKVDRLVAAEDRFREVAVQMQEAVKELREATMALGDPFLIVRTASQE